MTELKTQLVQFDVFTADTVYGYYNRDMLYTSVLAKLYFARVNFTQGLQLAII